MHTLDDKAADISTRRKANWENILVDSGLKVAHETTPAGTHRRPPRLRIGPTGSPAYEAESYFDSETPKAEIWSVPVGAKWILPNKPTQNGWIRSPRYENENFASEDGHGQGADHD